MTTNADDDQLLTALQVARHFGHTVQTTAELMEKGLIPALDDGELARLGRFDLPVVRRSRLAEAEAAMSTVEPSDIDTTYPAGRHPAVGSVVIFLEAVRAGEAPVVAALSTERTRKKAASDRDLVRLWRRGIGRQALYTAGVATGVYRLPCSAAVVIRLAADVGPFSWVARKPTPFSSAGFLPLIEEHDVWRLDWPLFEQQAVLAKHAGAIDFG